MRYTRFLLAMALICAAHILTTHAAPNEPNGEALTDTHLASDNFEIDIDNYDLDFDADFDADFDIDYGDVYPDEQDYSQEYTDTLPDIPIHKSFILTLQSALEAVGVTTDISSVMVYTGAALVPSAFTQEVCVADAFLRAEEDPAVLFTAAFGVEIESYSIPRASWDKAVVRNYVLRRILAREDTEAIMIKGGWSIPLYGSYWGRVNGINESHVIQGTQPWGDAELLHRPQHIMFLSVTNTSAASSQLLQQTIDYAVAGLRDSAPPHAVPNTGRLYGIDAVDWLIGTLHRFPFCTDCGSASSRTLNTILSLWERYFSHAVIWLNASHPSLSASQSEQMHEAAEAFARARDACTDMRALPLRELCTDPETQLTLLPHLRILRMALLHAEDALTPLASSSVRRARTRKDDEHTSRTDIPERFQLVTQLPLFSQLRYSAYPFLCGALMAGQLVGNADYSDWIVGCSGFPGDLTLDMTDLRPVYTTETDVRRKQQILRAQHITPLRYTLTPDSPDTAHAFIRDRIVASLRRGMPVLAEGLDMFDDVAVILGYDAYGKTLIVRTSYDTSDTFMRTEELPRTAWIYRGRTPAPPHETAIYDMLSFVIEMYEKTGEPPYVYGRDARLHVLNRCREYQVSPELMSTNFAKAHREFYTHLITQRRALYRFIDTAVTRVPYLMFPLSAARQALINEVEILNSALTDDIALTWLNDSFWPPGWTGRPATREIQILKDALEHADEAHMHMKIARDSLRRRIEAEDFLE